MLMPFCFIGKNFVGDVISDHCGDKFIYTG